MKITKVLGDNKYEVCIDPVDTDKCPINFGVAHDYVLFSNRSYLYTDGETRIKTEFGGTTNCLPYKTSLQIPIREMGEVILPKLLEHKYLQPEHFEKYIPFGESPITYWDDSETVFIYDKGQKKFIEISRELYNQLHTKP
jgi:hypothetical protein